ncbi:MAG: type II toxin-antitoxin system VapC family toxin [Cyclobacteriaceae bacterium]
MMKTGKAYLIDTNIIIDFFAKDISLVDKLTSENIKLPAVVVGELFYGAMSSTRKMQRVEQIDRFIDNFEIVSIDEFTSKYYGEIKASLKKAGTPIPENDIWIAALSIQHNLVLATRDNHFQKTYQIEVEFW